MRSSWEVRSTPGAAACFVLWQCQGVFLYHAFIFLITSGQTFFYFWGGGVMIGFLFFEAAIAAKLRIYREKLARGEIAAGPLKPLALVKWLITAALIALFFWLALAYPLPTIASRSILSLLFLAFSWTVSELASRLIRAGADFVEADAGKELYILPLIGCLLFGVAIASGKMDAIYLVGLMGTGITTLCVSRLLIQED